MRVKISEAANGFNKAGGGIGETPGFVDPPLKIVVRDRIEGGLGEEIGRGFIGGGIVSCAKRPDTRKVNQDLAVICIRSIID